MSPLELLRYLVKNTSRSVKNPREAEGLLSRGISPEHVFAKHSGLDMRPEAVNERALSLGFDKDVYHGSFEPLEKVRPGLHVGTPDAAAERLGFQEMYGAGDPALEDASIYPLRLRTKSLFPLKTLQEYGSSDDIANYAVGTSMGSLHPSQLTSEELEIGRLIKEKIRMKLLDAVPYENHGEDVGSLSYAVVDPSAIRSKFGIFDPELKDLPGLGFSRGGYAQR